MDKPRNLSFIIYFLMYLELTASRRNKWDLGERNPVSFNNRAAVMQPAASEQRHLGQRQPLQQLVLEHHCSHQAGILSVLPFKRGHHPQDSYRHSEKTIVYAETDCKSFPYDVSALIANRSIHHPTSPGYSLLELRSLFHSTRCAILMMRHNDELPAVLL